MKITKSKLKQIIKEELQFVLSEQAYDVRYKTPAELAAAYSEDKPKKKGPSYAEATYDLGMSKEGGEFGPNDIENIAKEMAKVHGFPSTEKSYTYKDKDGNLRRAGSRSLLSWQKFEERAKYYIMMFGKTKFDSKLEKEYLLKRKDYPEIGAVRKISLPRSSKDIKPFSARGSER